MLVSRSWRRGQRTGDAFIKIENGQSSSGGSGKVYTPAERAAELANAVSMGYFLQAVMSSFNASENDWHMVAALKVIAVVFWASSSCYHAACCMTGMYSHTLHVADVISQIVCLVMSTAVSPCLLDDAKYGVLAVGLGCVGMLLCFMSSSSRSTSITANIHNTQTRVNAICYFMHVLVVGVCGCHIVFTDPASTWRVIDAAKFKKAVLCFGFLAVMRAPPMRWAWALSRFPAAMYIINLLKAMRSI
jgi:hypothetical protein